MADSSPGLGRSRLYTSSSCWICWSVNIFSALAISCTWKRMVSRDSKVRVTTGPTLILRSFFTAMTRDRNSSRSRS